MKVSKIIQKLKPGQKAKDFAYALPHVGAGIVFASAVVVVAMQVASHFSEKAGEMVGKLGSEKLFYYTAVVGALTAIAGIVYLTLYRTTSKANKELESSNQTLKAGINFVASADESTTLKDVKAGQVFADAKEIA
ncbi:hypothetical protein [Candidatus Mesenet endosymbiont of Agriotes lineatus]|uniref:hypothetical protein n=1 Tax=Candidatus Mesenet endosymbiont of Agriotes lineatus TaxID=3077948 RepID=UPI0030CE290F